jgi:hypothetical protein
VPVTVLSSEDQGNTATFHSTFKGTISFNNVFNGKLPASDYPKVQVNLSRSSHSIYSPSNQLYFALLLAYAVLGCVWAAGCYKYRQDLLPIQVRFLFYWDTCLTKPSIISRVYSPS